MDFLKRAAQIAADSAADRPIYSNRLLSRASAFSVAGALLAAVGWSGCSSNDPAAPGTSSSSSASSSASSTSSGQSQSAVDRLVVALGGADAMKAAASERVTSTSSRFDPGEAVSPGTTRHVSDISLAETSLLGGGKTRADFAIKALFPGQIDLQFTEVRDGAGGFVSGLDNLFAAGPNGPPPPSAIQASRVQSADKHSDLFSPLRLVRRGISGDATLTADGKREVDGKMVDVVRVSEAKRQDILLFLDPATSLPFRSTTVEDHPPLGDTDVEVDYEEYKKVGALNLPFKVTLKLDGLVAQSEERSAIDLDVDPASDFFAFPPGVSPGTENPAEADFGRRSAEWLRTFGDFGLPLFYGLQAGVAMPAKLSTGVYLMMGPSHHSLLVELADRLVLIEAPLYPEWSAGLLTAIKGIQEIPTNKSLKEVVATHFHFDHSGGVREVVAGGGVTFYSADVAAPFFQDVFKRPHTIHPDTFSKSNPTVDVQSVLATQPTVLKGATGRSIELHQLKTTHADGMLIAYLPQEKMVFVADVYSPGFPTNSVAASQELYLGIQQLGLDVTQIVGAHGLGAGGPGTPAVVTIEKLKADAML